jgi:excisionase family DNA binding protein
VTSEDRLLTVPEVAERLACSRALVRRLGARGVLPRTKLGRLVRFRESDVARIVAEGIPKRPFAARGHDRWAA